MAEKIFTVDKFLGLNQSADGTTEIKLGEASVIENFTITDDHNLKTRPGIRGYSDSTRTGYLRAWTFFSGKYEYLALVRNYPIPPEDMQMLEIYRDGEMVYSRLERRFYNVFPCGDRICVLFWGETEPEHLSQPDMPQNVNMMYFEVEADGRIITAYKENPYIPLVLSKCTPSGNGTVMESPNLLTRSWYVDFVADGVAAEFVLPSGVVNVHSLWIDNEYTEDHPFTYNAETHTLTMEAVPEKDTEIKVLCDSDDQDLLSGRIKLLNMPYTEMFNGATDTRVFFYGDGSNICYYSGVPALEGGRGLYVPSGNELAVDFSTSPITGMIRHYSRMLAYKPDGVDAISYEPVTLEDGRVIAGFYLRPVNRDYGNEAPGQVSLVNNHPRTFSHGGIFEWRISSSNYRDERYAKCVSEKVTKAIAAADPEKLVACDDDHAKTYYVFLNDSDGTVLVNRYDLEVWSIYRSGLFTDVLQAFSFEGKMVFLRSDGLYMFDSDAAYDVDAEGNRTQISCVWESGYMAFGADYKRKYSSNIWVSMQPEYASHLEVTVRTDRRDEYLSKTVGLPVFDFSKLDFSNLSFLVSWVPKIQRIKIKVKKFVYYKLILRVQKSGARATVLGYDQQVRYSSNVK